MSDPPTDRNDNVPAWLTSVAFGVGSEVWMYRQASLMSKLDLTVVTKRHYNIDRFPANGFDVVRIRRRWKLPRKQSLRDLSLDMLARWNRSVPSFPASGGETRWWLAQLESRRPRVVLAHFGNHAMDVFPLFKAKQIPLVAHFNGFDLSRLMTNERYLNQLRRTAGQLAGYVVVAQYMREALLMNGVPAEKIHIIPYGVPPAERHDIAIAEAESSSLGSTSPSSASHSPRTQGPRFLSVGRFVDKKCPDRTVRAFQAVAQEVPTSRLVMIGDGPNLHACQSLAASLGIDGQIDFLGAQAVARVQQELTAADVFVQHSAVAPDGDQEGWPVAIAEAASYGLPVIATRHASIPEQIEDGIAGLLCDELDWKTMSQHMLRLARDHDLRRAMGRKAKQHMDSISVSRQVDRLQSLLLSVARQPW